MVKGTKSALFEVLEKALDNQFVTAVDEGGALLIDAMALFQSMKGKVKTFGDQILDVIVSLGQSFRYRRVDFVGDRYPKISVKDLERQNTAADVTQIIRISNASQPVPRQWKKNSFRRPEQRRNYEFRTLVHSSSRKFQRESCLLNT